MRIQRTVVTRRKRRIEEIKMGEKSDEREEMRRRAELKKLKEADNGKKWAVSSRRSRCAL